MTSARLTAALLPRVLAIALTALFVAGCAAGPGDETTDTAGRESTAVPGGSLAELQSGLSTGNPPAWYTTTLEELGYEVTTLRYERSDLLAYEVGKGETAFSIQLALDPEAGTATKIEIQPSDAAPVTPSTMQGEMPATVPGPDESTALPPENPGDPMATPAEPPADPASTPVEPAVGPAANPAEPVSSPAEPAADRPSPMEPPAPEPAAIPTPEPARVVALPAGTFIATLLNDPLDSGVAQVGDRFSMMVPEPISIAGIEVLPAGSRIWGYVADVQGARRPNTGGRIVLKADIIEAHGDSTDFDGLVTADGERLEGEGSVREDIKEIAVGAGVGGLVGGLLGGKKGVLAGILIGGGGTFVATKGEEVRLAPDTPLFVELREEVRVLVPR